MYQPIGGDYGSDEIYKQFFEKVINKIFKIKKFFESQNDNLD